MSHVTHVNESCHTCEWVMSHMWMSDVTHVNESCHTCEWVMSRKGMSLAQRNEPWLINGWVSSHIWISRVAHVSESWRTNGRVVARKWVRHTPSSHVTYTPSYFWGNWIVGIRVSHAQRSVYMPYLMNCLIFLARKGVYIWLTTHKKVYMSHSLW